MFRQVQEVRSRGGELAEECVDSHFAVNIRSFSIANRRNTFLLRGCDDSMTERHIFDGDLTIVEKCSHFKNKNVVIALIGNASTLKTFIKEKNSRAWFRSENYQYPDLIPVWGLQVQGVFRGLIRLLSS